MVGLTGEAALDIRDSAEQADITLFIAVVFLDCRSLCPIYIYVSHVVHVAMSSRGNDTMLARTYVALPIKVDLAVEDDSKISSAFAPIVIPVNAFTFSTVPVKAMLLRK